MNEAVDYGAACIMSRRGADSLSLTLMLFMAMNSLVITEMPVVTKGLQDRFSFSGGQIGLLTSMFLVAFAVCAIPMGLAAARWGGRTVVIGAGVLALGSIMFALSSSYPLFLAARLLQGIGGATVIPVSNPLMAQSVSARFHARCMGILAVAMAWASWLDCSYCPVLTRRVVTVRSSLFRQGSLWQSAWSALPRRRSVVSRSTRKEYRRSEHL